jgi:hypothetical protein
VNVNALSGHISLCPQADYYLTPFYRECNRTVKIRYIDDSKYIVQTNCDSVNDINNIMWSKERISKVDEIMKNFDINNTDINDIFESFCCEPILNGHTIYSSVMVPKYQIIQSQIAD